MNTTPRQRLLLFFAVILVFALLYPLSLWLRVPSPPCHSMRVLCRDTGMFNPELGNQVYKDCLNMIINDGGLGDIQVSAEEIAACRQHIERREKKGTKTESGD